MSKKQLIFATTVAAIPGAVLLVFLVMGLLQGMLSDTATVSPLLWVVWVVAALGSAIIAFLPIAIMFFPGLLPDPALAAAETHEAEAVPAPAARPQEGAFEDEEEFDEDFEDSEGEQLFEEDALDDDYDDDFSDSFEEDE